MSIALKAPDVAGDRAPLCGLQPFITQTAGLNLNGNARGAGNQLTS
jgi:hypothetical protein